MWSKENVRYKVCEGDFAVPPNFIIISLRFAQITKNQIKWIWRSDRFSSAFNLKFWNTKVGTQELVYKVGTSEVDANFNKTLLLLSAEFTFQMLIQVRLVSIYLVLLYIIYDCKQFARVWNIRKHQQETVVLHQFKVPAKVVLKYLKNDSKQSATSFLYAKCDWAFSMDW